MFRFSFAWKFQRMPLIIYLMRKFKIILGILGLLSSFVTMSADNSLFKEYGKLNMTGATYTARIAAAKAVVYADENMLSPLGYIANGKAIRVGNPRRMNKDLVPLIVQGRLAFIEIKDIRYEDSSNEEYKFKKGAPLEHNFDLELAKPEERISENNSLFLTLHAYTPGSEVKNTAMYFTEADVSFIKGFNLQFFHREQSSKFFWGLGLDYNTISSTGMTFDYLMAGPTVGFSAFKNNLFMIDFYGSLDFAIKNKLEIETNFTSEPTGFVWGPQVNARIVLYPFSKYHLLAGLTLRKYDVVGLDEIFDATDTLVPGIKSITGLGGFIGFGMDFR